MNIQLIDTFLKFLGLNLCISYTYFKITNYKNIKQNNKLILLLFNLCLSILYCFLKFHFSNILSTAISYLLYNYALKSLTNNKYHYSLLLMTISVSISYIAFMIAILLNYTFYELFKLYNYDNPINFIIIYLIESNIIHLFFKIKKFKHGFQFLKNKYNDEYFDNLIMIISVVIIFIYFLFGNFEKFSLHYIYYYFIVFTLLTMPIIQKTFILYQKQKLLKQTLKDYETELAQTKEKLNTALQEKDNLVKSNHEFYHRQEALKQKLNTLLNTQTLYNSETAEEFAQISDRINTLSKEYSKKTKQRRLLPKTNIPEIDDMFTYLQSECEKYEIDFILQINGDINHLIENIIPKNKLETLIGDLIRNSIIAINYSNTKFKSIMAILALRNNIFEFCVHDSGIEFEIPTLIKLGTAPATTHKQDGGTGIGFITTFETLNYCKASLIINENIPSDNNYTKSIIIKFDNSNNYCINSYRADIIKNINDINRDIIIN